jgi:hypothetical protein
VYFDTLASKTRQDGGIRRPTPHNFREDGGHGSNRQISTSHLADQGADSIPSLRGAS